MKAKGFVLLTLLGIVLVLCSACIEGAGPATTPTPTATPTVVVEDYGIHLYDVGVDKLYIDEVIMVLTNDGDASAIVTELVISSNDEEIRDYMYAILEPGEEEEITCDFGYYTGGLTKPIGVDEIAATIMIVGYPKGATGDRILAVEWITISIPKVSMGSTIQEIRGKQNLSLTLLSWEESPIAVDGPYASGYYTFTARPGMKFVILIYRFQNNDVREQRTPYINAGEIATDIGYIYSVWTPPLGIWSEEYNPREATGEEVNRLIGDSGAYEDLLPEESITGCVVFEIPADATSVEASIAYVLPLIKF